LVIDFSVVAVSTRVLSYVVVSAMVVVACAGNGAETTPASPVGSAAEPVVGAAQTIVSEHGDQEGFAALLLAVDTGYAIGQVIDHADQLTATGAIEGVEPSGPPLGLLEDPPEARGQALVILAMAVAQPSDWTGSDTYIDFIDNTVGDLFAAASEHLEEQRMEAAADEEFEQLVTVVAAGLLARGYSLEQVVEALVFKEWAADDLQPSAIFSCWHLDPPVVPIGRDLLSAGCAAVPLPESTTTSLSSDITSSQPAEEEASGVRYVGTVGGDAFGDGDVLINSVDLVVEEDLTGVIEMMGNAFVEGSEDTAGFCFYLRVEIEPGQVPSIDDGVYQGTVEAVGGLVETLCGESPPDTGLETATATLSADIDGDTMTGALEGEDGVPIPFTAARQG
jgi:hypothetical protein